MVFMAIACDIIWLIFRHIRPLPSGSPLEQNSQISETIVPPITQLQRAEARPK